MKHILLIISFISILATSCSSYNKVVKSDDYQRKFELANELFDKGQWLKSITLYEQVFQRVPKTAQGEIAYYRIGKAYFSEKDYYMGGYYLATFADKYPNSPKVEETMFLSSLCAVNNSPNYSLDQNETELALNDLQMFINRYPNSPLIDTCNVIMDKLRFKLEKKDFEAVKLYDKMENYKSALTSAKTFLEKYPKSSFREEAYFILVENSYLLAINSIEEKKKERIEETSERYRKFVAEFPQTSHLKSMDNMLKRLEEEKSKITNSKK